MTEKHTPTYEHLIAQITKLQALVTNPRFGDVIDEAVQFEMLPALVGLLTEFLEDPEIETFDAGLVLHGWPSDAELRNAGPEWLSPGRPGGILDRVIDETHAMAYGSLEHPKNIAERFREALAALFDVSGGYVEQSTPTGNPIGDVCRQFRSRLRSLEVREMNLYIERSADALSAIKELKQDAQAAASSIQRAAGKSGDEVMSSFYSKLAKSETESADKFRTLTAAFAMAAGTAALIFVLLPSGIFPAFEGSTSDIARLVQKTVFVAGIFGIAGYFARQAHQHRSMANWAESLSVQLQTFDAYLAAIDSPDVKDELRKSFAARAFGDHPAMKGEPTVTQSAAVMDAAVGLVSKLGGGSK